MIDNAQPQGYSQKFKSILSHAKRWETKLMQHQNTTLVLTNLRCTRECVTFSAGQWSILFFRQIVGTKLKQHQNAT